MKMPNKWWSICMCPVMLALIAWGYGPIVLGGVVLLCMLHADRNERDIARML